MDISAYYRTQLPALAYRCVPRGKDPAEVADWLPDPDTCVYELKRPIAYLDYDAFCRGNGIPVVARSRDLAEPVRNLFGQGIAWIGYESTRRPDGRVLAVYQDNAPDFRDFLVLIERESST